jgi:hypothetical protein
MRRIGSGQRTEFSGSSRPGQARIKKRPAVGGSNLLTARLTVSSSLSGMAVAFCQPGLKTGIGDSVANTLSFRKLSSLSVSTVDQ